MTTPQNTVQTDLRSLGLDLPPQRDRLLLLTFETKSGLSPFHTLQTFGDKEEQNNNIRDLQKGRECAGCFQVVISDHNNHESVSIGLLPLADGLVVKSEEFVTSHTVAWVLWVERSPTDHTTLSSSHSSTRAPSGLGTHSKRCWDFVYDS